LSAPDPESDDFIVFGRPCLGREEIEAATRVLSSGWIGAGPECARFERAFAERLGVDQALALNSCSSALWLALKLLGVGPGREVITTPVTFAATCNVVEHLGARVVFVDVDPATGNFDPNRVADCVNERTAAVLVVHLAGHPVDLGPLIDLRERTGVPIVEDCAHAVTGHWRGRPLGTIGDAGAFSFYATKNLTTAEGGMLLFSDPTHFDRARRLAQHGLSADAWSRYREEEGFRHFEVHEPGYKFNLTDLQAAIGLAQLEKLDEHEAHRTRLFAYYREELASLPIELPPEPDPAHGHGRHLFSPRLRLEDAPCDRDELIGRLRRAGIGSGVHYVSLHLHRYYRERYDLRDEDFPAATEFSRRSFSIPLSGCLSRESAVRVVRALHESLAR
jgi:dTDP-4-amino-4,6-dideoxygalactose transaminase